MMFWLATIILVTGAALFVLVPLWRNSRPTSFTTGSLLLPLALVLLITAGAYLLYDEWGYFDDVRLMSLFQRTVDNRGDINDSDGNDSSSINGNNSGGNSGDINNRAQEAEQLIIELGAIVMEDAEQAWAWYFLAENLLSLGKFQEAEIAYRQSASRLQGDRDKALALGRVALSRYINSGFEMTAEIMEIIEQARALNPSEVSVLQLLASVAEEQQDWEAAIEYWRLLIQINPNSQQANVLRQRISEARTLSGVSNVGSVDNASNVSNAGDVGNTSNADDVDSTNNNEISGPVIEVTVTLADNVQISPEQIVFVSARNAEQENMPPLAVARFSADWLPTTVILSNSLAVGPFNLSSADTVYVSALISANGTANAASGDYRVVSENFNHKGQTTAINLVVSERIP
ncbi:MAG: tetratricopeptide repeat protein [Pseudohongiellaceae bacterium]